MKVMFRSLDPAAAPLRKITTQRVRFTMRRLTWLVPRATVQFSDINGPEGGVDKRCQLELMTAAAQPLVITSIARDWGDALNQSLSRAARAVVREWRQRQSRQVEARPRAMRTLRGLSAG